MKLKPVICLLISVFIANSFSTVKAQDLKTKIDSLLLTVFKDNNGPGVYFL